MKMILLSLLLFTSQAFGQISSPTVDANITGGSLTLSGTSAVSQSGVWTTGRTWSLLNTTDSVNSVQSGTWNVGLLTGSNTIGSVTQSGAWTTGRTWSLLNTTDSVNAVQSGTWNLNNISGTISLPTGASTSALQTSGNASLTSIDGKLTAFDLDNTGGVSNILGVSIRGLANGTPVELGNSANPLQMNQVSVQRTPGFLVTTTTGTVTAGARSVSFYNSGNANATVLGSTLAPFEVIEFTAPGNDTLAAIAYVATGTTLKIVEVR